MAMEAASATRIEERLGRAFAPVKPADALCTATTSCLRCGRGRLAGDLLDLLVGRLAVRSLVLFALIACVACASSPRQPDAAATLVPGLGPVPTLPAIASPDTVPTVPVPSVVAPIASAVPLPSAASLPSAMPIPSVVSAPGASARPLSTIPIVIRSAAPIPAPVLPVSTSLPILPPIVPPIPRP